MSRKTPTIAITTPAVVKMPAKWLMSPAGGLMEEYAMIAPTMMSINPNTFSTTVNPMGISALNPEPSRFNFTLSRLILIYLILSIKNIIRFNFTKPHKLIDAITVSKKHV
jgi:hypothetical protein